MKPSSTNADFTVTYERPVHLIKHEPRRLRRKRKSTHWSGQAMYCSCVKERWRLLMACFKVNVRSMYVSCRRLLVKRTDSGPCLCGRFRSSGQYLAHFCDIEQEQIDLWVRQVDTSFWKTRWNCCCLEQLSPPLKLQFLEESTWNWIKPFVNRKTSRFRRFSQASNTLRGTDDKLILLFF